MRKLLLASALLLVPSLAFAQPLKVPQARVVANCGTPPSTYVVGQLVEVTIDTNGNLCGSSSGGVAATVNQGAANAGGAAAWPVTTYPSAIVPTDRGGTITLGGTAQNAMGANASRKSGWIQNPCSATEDLFISTSATATITGVGDDADLAPCGSFSLIQNGVIQSAVSVIAATTSHRWLAKETQ